VLVDLASYTHLALGVSGTKWSDPIAEKIITRLMELLPAALTVQFLCNRLKGEQGLLARIIHECRREAFETEARRSFSQVRPTWRTLSPSRRPNEKSPAGREDRTT